MHYLPGVRHRFHGIERLSHWISSDERPSITKGMMQKSQNTRSSGMQSPEASFLEVMAKYEKGVFQQKHWPPKVSSLLYTQFGGILFYQEEGSVETMIMSGMTCKTKVDTNKGARSQDCKETWFARVCHSRPKGQFICIPATLTLTVKTNTSKLPHVKLCLLETTECKILPVGVVTNWYYISPKGAKSPLY